jgi:hypothetical protein
MPEDTFKLLELDGCEVRHVACDHLIFEEGEFLCNGGFHETKLVGEFVVGVGCEVVLFNVGFLALGVEVGEGIKEGVERREIGVQALDMGALVVNVAVKAGDGEGEGVEGEGKVVGFIGKGAAEGILDAAGRISMVRGWPGRDTDSRIVSLMIWLLSLSDLRRTAHS